MVKLSVQSAAAGVVAAQMARLQMACRVGVGSLGLRVAREVELLDAVLGAGIEELSRAVVRALLPHVDSFRAAHSIDSLRALAEALTRPKDKGMKARMAQLIGTEDRNTINNRKH